MTFQTFLEPFGTMMQFASPVGMAGCISFGRKKKARAKSQPVYKSESGVPFNDTNLDSARGGPQEGGTPKNVVPPLSIEEPDHAPPGLYNCCNSLLASS